MKTMVFTIAALSGILGYTAFQIEAYAMDRIDSPTKTLKIVSANVDNEKAIAFSAAFGGVQ